MSALLAIIEELREVRDSASEELRRAILRASREGGHTGRDIAKAAGITPQRVSQILNRKGKDEE